MTSLGKTLIEASYKSKLLQHCPICSGLDDDSLMGISEIAHEKTYERGQFLMQEGDKSSGFFLVLSGKVRVYKSSPNGKEKVLLIAEAGMTFGEDALFGEGLFLQMAVAQTRTHVLLIPRQGFLSMLKNNSGLAFQVMESLCMWIRRLSTSVENVAFLSTKDKTARFLLDLSLKADSTQVELPGKKKEIADQLGLAPETFSRALHDFSENNVIKVEHRKIQILDLDQLQDISSRT